MPDKSDTRDRFSHLTVHEANFYTVIYALTILWGLIAIGVSAGAQQALLAGLLVVLSLHIGFTMGNWGRDR